MVERAARFSTSVLIPSVLRLERELSRAFHKGALFYDTGLAYLISGDDEQFEFFLAMADEENYLTGQIEGGTPTRGAANLRVQGLARQTLEPHLVFFKDLLNGAVTGSNITFAALCGSPVTVEGIDRWREGLEQFHHYEMFRILNEIELFGGCKISNYQAVLNHPYVMLRLVKSLAHAAQWVESDLTQLQSGTERSALWRKLDGDTDFACLKTVPNRFPGQMPDDAQIESALRQLLTEAVAETLTTEKQWRILRVLYIMRNATAHVINPSLPFYIDRSLLLELIQVVLISAFVIRQLKRAAVP